MGKDNDIIDVMFNAMIQLVSWIFKQLFNLLVWIITGLYNLIASAISKNKSSSNNSQNSNVDNDAVRQLFIDTKDYVNKLNSESLDVAEAEEIIALFSGKIITNTFLSVDEKCELLSMLNNKLQEKQKKDPSYYNSLFASMIGNSYSILDSILEGKDSFLLNKYGQFKNDWEQKKVTDFEGYFGELFAIAGLLGSPNGKFSIEYSVFDKYDFPKYKVEE